MSDGPHVLVDVVSRQPVLVGSTRDTIRQGDALRWQCTLLAIEAPTNGEPHGRVTNAPKARPHRKPMKAENINNRLAALRAMGRFHHRTACEEIELDKKFAEYEAGEWRAFCEFIKREELELLAKSREFERREKMRREYIEAVRQREAMITDWFSNVRNNDIAQRVRELAKNAGPGVIDLVEYKRELPGRRYRQQSGG